MFFLSPVKLLFVLTVALVVLGPDKLPAAARKVGGLWADLRRMRERLEQEVRGSFPDLPPTHELTRMARSPLNYLDRLAQVDQQKTSDVVAPITFTIPGTAPPEAAATVDSTPPQPQFDDSQLN